MSLLSRLNIFEALVQGILSNPVFLATVQQFHVSSVFSVFKFNEQKWTKCLKNAVKNRKKSRGPHHNIRISRRELLYANVEFQAARRYYTGTNQLRLKQKKLFKPRQRG
jgi:hypothetical protein